MLTHTTAEVIVKRRRQRLLAMLTGALAVALSALAIVPGTAAADQPRQYLIVSANSFKCLNVSGGGPEDGARVIQYNCAGALPNERWTIENVDLGAVRIKAVNSDKCLNVQFASPADGAAVIQYHCTGSPNEKWRLSKPLVPPQGVSGVQIVAVHSEKCLNVSEASKADKANVIQYHCVGGATLNEQWNIIPV
jgi:uncharacterized membrane protein